MRFRFVVGFVLLAAALDAPACLAAEAVPQPGAIPVPEVVGGLQGCWNAPGQVRGKDATSIARGDWHVGHLYFMLQLRALSGPKPYVAAIIYGGGPKVGTFGSYWLDVFGGTAPTQVSGAPTKDGFTVAYDYGDSVYTNLFAKTQSGWRWTIIERFKGKPEKLFARYEMTPASCEGKTFDF